MMSPTRRRGFRDEMGSWKIICIRVRIRRRSSPSSSVSSVPSKATRPCLGGGTDQRSAGGRLAAPGLADEPKGLTGRMSRLTSLTADLQPGAPDGELHREVLGAQQRLTLGAEVRRPLPAIRPPHCHRGSRRRRWPPPPWSARGPGEGSPPVPSCPPGTPPGTSRRTGGQGVSDPQRRLVLVTAGLGVENSGAEVAALRRIDEVRRPAGDDLELGVRLVLEPGDRRGAPLCRACGRWRTATPWAPSQRSCLRTSPRSHRPVPRPHPGRDEHEGHEPLPLLLGEEVQDLGLHGHVER